MGHRNVRWGLVVAGCILAAAAGLVLVRKAAAPRLPGLSSYGGRPAAFNEALEAARDKVRRGDYDAEDLRSLAHLFQANRLDDEALATYGVVSKRAPLNAHDHYYLSELAQMRGDLSGAAKELRSAIEAEPGYLPARLTLGAMLLKSGQTDDAQKEYAAILSTDPGQPQATFTLARIDLMQGKDDLAIARLEALIASHPDMTSAAGLLAQVFDRRGDDKRASALRQWSRQKPEPEPVDPWMDSLMGDCYDTVLLGLKFEEYFAMGQITRALPFIDRIEELDPKSPVPELLRGWEQSSNHHEEEAVAEYEKALAKGADPEKICPYIVKSLVALKRIDDAERLMAEFYAKKPDSIPILEAYATVAVLRDDTRTARMLLAKVLEKEPYLNSANLNMAKILWSAGERDAAAVCLERLVEMNPADVASRALLGQYFLGNSEPGSAIVPLEQAVALENAQSPRYKSLTAMLYTAYLLAGNAESDRGHIADAVGKFYDKAIKLAPDDATAYASKAVACAQHKEFRSAADALETMTSLQPRNPTIYLSLGDVLYQEGYSEQARRNWQRALSLAPDGSTELRNAIGERLSGNITADTFR